MINIRMTSYLIIFVFSSILLAQSTPILDGQKKAIHILSSQHGFTETTFQNYIINEYGVQLDQLTQSQGSELIRRFQSGNIPPPQPIVTTALPAIMTPAPKLKPKTKPDREPVLAGVLEVGMNKRFHLVDGSIYNGEIVDIVDGICHIESIDGLLKIPVGDILDETAIITKKDDTRYIGPIMRETSEEIVLRSKYGDVVISKREVKEMDRYHGGRLFPWAEEKKTFFRGEVVLTDIFTDPTAFPLTTHTFYISGLSLGYGFTERFMVRTNFGSDFQGDLNFTPHLRFYHRQTGTSQRAAAVGGHLFNHHPMETLVAKYAKYVVLKEAIVDTINNIGYNKGESLNNIKNVTAEEVLADGSKLNFYWELYVVLSSRYSLASRRGELGWHVGAKTNSLALQKPGLIGDYKWDTLIPFRVWAAFEYDLSKNLKLAGIMWVDNGHKFRTFDQVWTDYIQETPFILDSKSGEYRMVDFDFGFLYAVGETFRIGIHFQEPFLVFYWEFFEL